MKHILFIFIGGFILFISSCAKEGKGGGATIEGKVMVRLIKESTLDTLTTFEAQDTRVYIIYGDNESYDDDVRTSYNGNFRFDFLYKGDYSVFVYSDCVFLVDSCPNGSKAELREVEINKPNERHNLGEIVINKYIK